MSALPLRLAAGRHGRNHDDRHGDIRPHAVRVVRARAAARCARVQAEPCGPAGPRDQPRGRRAGKSAPAPGRRERHGRQPWLRSAHARRAGARPAVAAAAAAAAAAFLRPRVAGTEGRTRILAGSPFHQLAFNQRAICAQSARNSQGSVGRWPPARGRAGPPRRATRSSQTSAAPRRRPPPRARTGDQARRAAQSSGAPGRTFRPAGAARPPR